MHRPLIRRPRLDALARSRPLLDPDRAMRRVCSLLFALLLAAQPGLAAASGGLFADAVDTLAVEQNRSRVLLTVSDDGTVTAAFEIAFSGSPEAFAWLIPVPSDPTLEVVPPSTLRLLDAATAPRVVPPPLLEPPLEGDDDDAATDDDDDGGEPAPDLDELEQVGPYDPTLLGSDDPDAVIDWLRDNGYLVTEEMEPLVASYVDRGWSFLGLRLAPEAGVADIQPIAITWEAEQATIPLIVTGVAAEPEMGIAVFVAGGSTFEPTDRPSLLLDSDLLQLDPRTGASNYHALVSWLADQEDGQAFFTEYSDASADLLGRLDALELATPDADEARLYLEELAGEAAWFTRLYSRMSGPEMLADPTFGSMNSQVGVAPLHDLSDRAPVPIDTGEVPPVPCGDTWCGPGGLCATTDDVGVDGCACDDGFAVRRIVAPRLGSEQPLASVTCQDTAWDLMASIEAGLSDPCAGWDCGIGECVVTGGVAACACFDGAAGVPRDGRVTCVDAVELYSPDQLLWPGWPQPPQAGDDDDGDDGADNRGTVAEAPELAGCGCASAPGPAGALGLLLLLPLLRRRR